MLGIEDLIEERERVRSEIGGISTAIRTITRTQADNIALLLKSSEGLLNMIEKNTRTTAENTREIADLLAGGYRPAPVIIVQNDKTFDEKLARDFKIRKRALGG